jgi:hypothetical protein
MEFVASPLLRVIGLSAVVGCDSGRKDEDEIPTTSEQETSTETQNETDPMSTETWAKDTGTDLSKHASTSEATLALVSTILEI